MNILIPDIWLRDHLKTKVEPQKIKKYLSLCGPSVERVIDKGRNTVYDIEITTNRIDCMSIKGIAREAAAILPRFNEEASLKTKKKISVDYPRKNLLPISIEDPENLCPRILAVVMDNINIKSSPENIRKKLELAGVRSLNNYIDITNYVMLELGHPCHVFDYDRINTGKLLIRHAKKGESLITLDGKKCILQSHDVVIDDGTGRIIDLPGIIGTKNSVITNNTKRIVFFIESNNPTVIRKTSLRLGVRTLAATMNEKGPDPYLAKKTIEKAVIMAIHQYGAKIKSPLVDIFPKPPQHKSVKISLEFINKRLGISLPKSEVMHILKSLHFEVKNVSNSQNLTVKPPSFRSSDIQIEEDIVEEVARLYGYHQLPSKLMTGKIPTNRPSQGLDLEYKTKLILKYLGFTEIYTYSFVSKKLLKQANMDIKKHLKVSNPLTQDTEYLRLSLIPSLLETVKNNQHFDKNLKLFELASIYKNQKNDLPEEKRVLVIACQSTFYDLKGYIETIFKEFGLKNVIEKQTNKKHWLSAHPFQELHMLIDSKTIAKIATLDPKVSKKFNLKEPLYIAEIDFGLLFKNNNPDKKYNSISQYPEAFEDLSIIDNKKTNYKEIENAIRNTSKFVKRVVFVNKYKNTLTLNITYHNPRANLTNKDIKTIRKNILKNLKQQFQIKLKK